MASHSLHISSPYIEVLVSFLSKDKLQAAVNMVRTWMNVSSGAESVQPLCIPGCCTDCCISRSIRSNNGLPYGYKFHWSSILQELSLIRIVEDEKENKLKHLPLFLTLPVIAQRNFILLINEFQPSIPTHSLMNFISTIQCNINRDSSSWLEYLLTSLITNHTNDTTESKDKPLVPFNKSLLCRISSTFGFTDSSSNVLSYYDDQTEQAGSNDGLTEQARGDDGLTKQAGGDSGLKGTNPCVNTIDNSPNPLPCSSRKRPIDEDDHKDFNQPKVRKMDLSDHDNEMEGAEVNAVQLKNDDCDDRISNTQECVNQQTAREAMLSKMGSEILKQWQDGVLCSQSDFDELISSSDLLTAFIQEAVAHTYSDNGIQSMITNLLNSKTVITHFNLLNYFKLLLVEKIVELYIKNIPRSLTSLITSLFEKHPFSFVEGFLLSFVCHDKFASNHCVVACKMIKDSLTNDHCIRLWTNIMRVSANSALKWSDQLMSCLTVLIDKSGATFHVNHNDFVCSLEINATHHSKNTQFAKFLLLLIIKCKSKLSEVKDILMKIVTDNKSPLKRNLLKQLEDTVP